MDEQDALSAQDRAWMASLSPEAQSVLSEDPSPPIAEAPEGSFSPGYPETGQKTDQSQQVVSDPQAEIAELKSQVANLTKAFNDLPNFLMEQFKGMLGGEGKAGPMNALLSQLGGDATAPAATAPAAPGQAPASGGGIGGGDWLSQLSMLLNIAERTGLIKPNAAQQQAEPVEVAMDQLGRMLSLFGGFKQMVFEEFRNTGAMMRSMRDVFGRDYLLENDNDKGKEVTNDANRGQTASSGASGAVRRPQASAGKVKP